MFITQKREYSKRLVNGCQMLPQFFPKRLLNFYLFQVFLNNIYRSSLEISLCSTVSQHPPLRYAQDAQAGHLFIGFLLHSIYPSSLLYFHMFEELVCSQSAAAKKTFSIFFSFTEYCMKYSRGTPLSSKWCNIVTLSNSQDNQSFLQFDLKLKFAL